MICADEKSRADRGLGGLRSWSGHLGRSGGAPLQVGVWTRLVACGCLAVLSLPVVALGQSRPLKSDAAENFAPSVSVRELQIPDKARGFYNKGAARMAVLDWAGSVPEFRRAVTAYSDFYEAYYKIGIAELELQMAGEAEKEFRKSIELSEGRFVPALFALGLTLGNGGEFEDALGFIRAGLSLEPMNARGHFTLAWVLYSAGRVVEAEKSGRQAVSYAPDFAMARLLLAQIHRRLGDLDGMVGDLDAFLRLEPDGARSGAARMARASAQRTLEQAGAGDVAVASAQQ
jgi:tetratricopeptide (TPR) repeat protein